MAAAFAASYRQTTHLRQKRRPPRHPQPPTHRLPLTHWTLTASDGMACMPLLPESVTASAPVIEKKKAVAAKTKASFRFIL
jgi:hypothetical protein